MFQSFRKGNKTNETLVIFLTVFMPKFADRRYLGVALHTADRLFYSPYFVRLFFFFFNSMD